MRVALRWPAQRWQKGIPWQCRLFGHVWHAGWWGSTPYLTVRSWGGYTDGTGRKHHDLTCQCTRDGCNATQTIAHIHGNPKDKA